VRRLLAAITTALSNADDALFGGRLYSDNTEAFL
jgi:hypothetical protein